jgi:hypothetical protein
VALTNYISDVYTLIGGRTQYVAKGWTLAGGADTNGLVAGATGTNVTLVLTNAATLTWLWATNYQLTIVSSNGTVTGGSNGFYTAGTNLMLLATPATNYVLARWTLDGVNIGTNMPLNVTIDGAHTVEAVYEMLFVNASSFADIQLAWSTNYLKGTLNAIVTISNRQSSAKVMLAPVWFEIPSNRINRLRYPTGVDTKTAMPYIDVSTDFSNKVVVIGNHNYGLDPGEVVTLSPIEIYGYQAPIGMVVAIWADPIANSGALVGSVHPAFSIWLNADKSVGWDSQSNWLYDVECACDQPSGFQVVAQNILGRGVCASFAANTNSLPLGNGGSGAVFYRVKAVGKQ